jgi:hypothetical protein
MSDPFERAVERERFERRQRRYKAVWKRLAIHLRTYLIVNFALVAIWGVEALLENGHPLWFIHIAWAWGIALFVHYVLVTQLTGQWWPRRNASLVADSEPQQSQ